MQSLDQAQKEIVALRNFVVKSFDRLAEFSGISKVLQEFKKDGIYYNYVTIRGGLSSVELAENIINKINSSEELLISVPKKRITRLFVDRLEMMKLIQKSLNIKIFTRLQDEEVLEWVKSKKIDYTKFSNDNKLIKIVGEKEDLVDAKETIRILMDSGKEDCIYYLNTIAYKPNNDIFDFGDATTR